MTPTGAAAFLVCRAAVAEAVGVGALLVVVVVVECRVEDDEELSLMEALVLLRCTLLEEPETLAEEDVMVEERECEVE